MFIYEGDGGLRSRFRTFLIGTLFTRMLAVCTYVEGEKGSAETIAAAEP